MSSDYPFPIPEEAKSEILSKIAEANPPWKVLDDWRFFEGEPSLFGYFDCWHGHTVILLRGLKYLIEQLEPPLLTEDPSKRFEWETVRGIVLALEHRFGQFEGLLEWARLSWPHDPKIQKRKTEGKWEEPALSENPRPVGVAS